MNSQEIIGEDMQRERGGKIGFLFGKARSQSGQAAHFRPQVQVHSFDIGRGREIEVRIPANGFALYAFERTWTIPFSVTWPESEALAEIAA
jgi:hypothetical protein